MGEKKRENREQNQLIVCTVFVQHLYSKLFKMLKRLGGRVGYVGKTIVSIVIVGK